LAKDNGEGTRHKVQGTRYTEKEKHKAQGTRHKEGSRVKIK